MNDFPLDFEGTLRQFTPGARIFDRYILGEIIGRGRRGDVWEARDERLSLQVAIKLLVNFPHADIVERGIAGVMDLTHPNIVRVYDFLRQDNLCGFVMEQVRGQSLSDLLRTKPSGFFEASEVEPWARELFAALHFAWNNANAVHGDIRPGNLLVSAAGALKISEFGLSPMRREGSVLDTGGDTSGLSLPCLSPQLVAGQAPTHQDDLYAAGACLYELLTGKPVFPGGNILAQIERKVPPSVAVRRAELQLSGAPVPPVLEKVIAKCLAKEREDRPADAGTVLAMLGEARTSRATARFTDFRRTATDAVAALRPAGGWRAPLAHPAGKGAAAAVALGLGFLLFVKMPNDAKVAAMRAEYDELRAQDSQPPAEENPGARAGKWKAFLDANAMEEVSFTSADNTLLRMARKWRTEWEEKADLKAREDAKAAAEERRVYAELSEAIERLDSKTPAPAAKAALAAWRKMKDDHAAGPKAGSPKIAGLLKEVDERIQELEEKEKAAREQEEEREKKAAAEKAAWLEAAKRERETTQLVMDSPENTAAVRLRAANALGAFARTEVPAGAAAEAKVLADEAEAMRSKWAAAAEAENPKEPLKLDALFKNSPYATAAAIQIWLAETAVEDPPEKLLSPLWTVILKKAQEKLFAEVSFEGSATAKADGVPGQSTHRALLAYQNLPGKNLTPNGELDTNTLKALGLAELRMEFVVEARETLAEQAEKPQTAQPARKKSSGGGGGSSRKKTVAKKPQQEEGSIFWKIGQGVKKGYQATKKKLTQ